MIFLTNSQIKMKLEKITINATLVYELADKQKWIRRFPGALPELPKSEKYLWIDANGNQATCGADFMSAETQNSYPIKIYLVQRIDHITDKTYLHKLLALFK